MMFYFACTRSLCCAGAVVDGDNNNTSSRALEIILQREKKTTKKKITSTRNACTHFVFVHKHNMTVYLSFCVYVVMVEMLFIAN